MAMRNTRRRSRSPRVSQAGKSAFWISHAILRFGRYPETRPAGLLVDEYGQMQLRSLMSVWGHKHDLCLGEIVNAVRENEFHKDGGESRFMIGEDVDGEVTITVFPSRHAACRRPHERHLLRVGRNRPPRHRPGDATGSHSWCAAETIGVASGSRHTAGAAVVDDDIDAATEAGVAGVDSEDEEEEKKEEESEGDELKIEEECEGDRR